MASIEQRRHSPPRPILAPDWLQNQAPAKVPGRLGDGLRTFNALGVCKDAQCLGVGEVIRGNAFG
jgi:hypothetical protein